MSAAGVPGPLPPALAAGWAPFDTPIGTCALAWNAALAVTACRLPGANDAALHRQMQRLVPGLAKATPPPGLAAVIVRIVSVLEGARDTLEDVPLDLSRVPPFHRRVYAAARHIPPGQTCLYGDLARSLGEPGAARAVGQALGDNPFAPIVPCHRVLAAGGRPGGFSAPGGLATKLRMLELERAHFGGQPGLFT